MKSPRGFIPTTVPSEDFPENRFATNGEGHLTRKTLPPDGKSCPYFLCAAGREGLARKRRENDGTKGRGKKVYFQAVMHSDRRVADGLAMMAKTGTLSAN